MAGGPDGRPSHVIVGRIRRAHGVRGEVVVELQTGSPDAIFAPGARVLLGTTHGDAPPAVRDLHVRGARGFKDGLLVTFDEVADRNAADLLRDRYLLVPFGEVEEPAEDEVFLHDLVGLSVEGASGRIGEVVGYFDAPGGLLLEIKRDRDVVLLPYRMDFVRDVDLDGRRLLVDVPEGMFD